MISIDSTKGSFNILCLDCLEHDRNVCHECKDVGMCDGQTADDCDFMNLTEFETTLKNRLTKLDDQFAALNEILKMKKEAFTKLYRKDPRISHDETFLRLQAYNEAFDPTHQEELPELEAVDTVETMPIVGTKQIVVCDRFSDDNEDVTVSSCKRSVKIDPEEPGGYCFLNHQKIDNNKLLQWNIRVPKFKGGLLGMVIIC